MRHGCKAGWLIAVLKETHMKMEETLPGSYKSTIVMVGSMCFIQHHQFLEGETLSQYHERHF